MAGSYGAHLPVPFMERCGDVAHVQKQFAVDLRNQSA